MVSYLIFYIDQVKQDAHHHLLSHLVHNQLILAAVQVQIQAVIDQQMQVAHLLQQIVLALVLQVKK